jgi:hypothetical protein
LANASASSVINCYEDDGIDESEIKDNKMILPGPLALGEFSFCDSSQKRDEKSPAPIYFSDEFLMKDFGNLPV